MYKCISVCNVCVNCLLIRCIMICLCGCKIWDRGVGGGVSGVGRRGVRYGTYIRV